MQSAQPHSAAATTPLPHDLARAVGVAMFASDKASREFMQMELLACEPGHASMRMAVRPELLNGLSICHGGFIFTLADSTFAFACNSYNTMTVASGCSIEFLKSARLGDILTCIGQEQSLHCLLYTSPSPRDRTRSRMPSSA